MDNAAFIKFFEVFGYMAMGWIIGMIHTVYILSGRK